jgi:RsiW-degrading membrane proteinase PrsW (M82 family)
MLKGVAHADPDGWRPSGSVTGVLETLTFVAYLAAWALIIWRFARRDADPGDWVGTAGAVTLAGGVLLVIAYYGDRHDTEPLAVIAFAIFGGMLFVSGVLTFVLNALPAPRRR